MSNERILRLPDEAIKNIRAGQVIADKLDIVKELLDNALDAGATKIRLDLSRKSLVMIDNGRGIKRTDSAAVCKINYTSKIRTFEDMSSLRSYGFRGEALWGILRLGKVHITSRTNQSDVGWHSTYTRDGVTEPSSIAAAKGTTIKILDLSQCHTAAHYSELRNILNRMKHYKLFHPSVEICYYSDDVDKIPRSLGTDPKTLIPELFDVEHNLIGFQTSNDLHSSGWGYIGATDVSTPDFILAVNGRPIQHSGLKRKLRDSYKAFLGVQACRSLYLNLVLDPGQVDFNKDPKKSTVGLSMDLLDELSAEITHSLNRVRVESRPQSLVRSKDSGPENQNADQESANTTVLPDTIACHHIICQTPNTTYCLIVEASRRIFVIDGSQLTSAEELESDIESYEDQFTKMQQTDPGLVLNGVEIGFLRFLHLNSNQ